ncbi:sarcosine dehydrogenase, mitochondrial-like [Bolinopsis microptera]|uniref:sarcosine dehydrogenase, mitochondrial-like n=1 Tax=Bolinopsis microptera TaxID=2820187 RepID=UPI003078E315
MLRTLHKGLSQQPIRQARYLSEVAADVPHSKDKTELSHASDLPTHAEVVVIGGGSIGNSTLYHLGKKGVKGLLLEKDQLTAGTTWHSAGLIWSLRPNDTDSNVIGHTLDLVRSGGEIEQLTGMDCGFNNNGGIFVANNKERFDEYRRLKTFGKYLDVDTYVLSPSETKDLYPLMNVDDVYATLYSPADGCLDPSTYVSALSRAGTMLGGQIVTETTVTGIETETTRGRKRVTGVQTNKGLIKTEKVINCTGAWGPYISEMAGVDCPLVPFRHAYVVTEDIEGIENMPNVRDHDLSAYLRLQGNGLSVGGYEPHPDLLPDGVAKDFAFGLYELDWDTFGFNIEACIKRVPIIEYTGLKSTVCGPESFTPDHKPLLGESLDCRGFYQGCGFNSSGIMLAGGCGRELANMAVEGTTSIDMFGYDVNRYHPDCTKNKAWVLARSHEAYVKNYAMVFIHDENLAMRDMRTDVLHETLLSRGCVYQQRQGHERPGYFAIHKDSVNEKLDYDWYGSYGNEVHPEYPYRDRLGEEYTFGYPQHFDVIGAESHACRERAALFNMSYFGKFFLTGPDAQAVVDYLCCSNINKGPGGTVYTNMLNKNGGSESDLTVSHIEPCPETGHDRFYVACGGGSSYRDMGHILNVIDDKKFDCSVADHSSDYGMLSLQGPKSRAILESICDNDLSNEAFPFSSHQLTTIGGHEVRLMRLTFVGELGWELHIPSDALVDVYNTVMAAGEPHGIVDSGYRAIDSLSSEKGYKHWHEDVRPDTTPLEAGMAWLVNSKLKTGVDFLGRDALLAQKKSGIKKRLVCLKVESPVPLVTLEAISRDGDVVGWVSRTAYGYSVGCNVAWGYIEHPEKIKLDWVKSGKYQVECMGEVYDAEVSLAAPFDPKNLRVKGIYE